MEIVVVGGGEKLYSQNLGDFLRIKEEDHWRNNLNQSTPSSSGGGRRVSSGVTLNAILTEKVGQSPPSDAPPQRRVEPNRTLLDIIRDDQTSGVGRGGGDGRKSWLLNKIRLRRRGGRSAWPAAVATSSSVANNNNHHRMMMATATRPHSDRFNTNISSDESAQPGSRTPGPLSNPRPSTESGRFEPMLPSRQLTTEESNSHQDQNEELRSDAVEAAAEVGVPPEQPAVRMSLMALLAENDRQMGLESSAYMTDEVGFESEVGVEKEAATSSAASATGLEYNNCCVCMVRHKGAAFIPCGHTFCRLCSRELWMQRGKCPLCNNFIREILDIF